MVEHPTATHSGHHELQSIPAPSVSRVLIADDDRDLSRLIEIWLSARGFEVDRVANGWEASRVFETPRQT